MTCLSLTRHLVLVALCFFTCEVISQDIYSAVSAGDVENTREYIQKDPELLNQRNADLFTPLNLAAYEDQFEVARLLLELGADPSIGDRENSQPVHLAAISGSIPVLDMLLKHGVDIETRDINHMTPLLFATSRGQVEMAEHLVELGADVKAQSLNGFTCVHLAAISGRMELMELFLGKGAKVNTKTDIGFTPLHSAASYGRTEAVKLLIEKGADIHAETDMGAHPLAYALGPNTYDAAEYLILNGADVNHRDERGFTALHDAVGRGNVANAGLLIDYGANVNAASQDGLVPFTLAAWAENAAEMGRFLILNGADVNPDPCKENKECTCGPHFRTPLHSACMVGKEDLVKILVQNGAKINVLSNDGYTPLHYAVRSGNLDVVKYLVKNDAFLNVKDDRAEQTELHLAALMGYGDIVDYLIEKGSCFRMVDHEGNTPMDYAFQHGQKPIAYDMLAAGADDAWLKSYINKECPVSQPVAGGQARVWFLGHSGWAIKTQNHLLIFDYFDDTRSRKPDHECLLAGCIKPEELKKMNVTVFSTHEHGDHFSPSIFTWREEIPDAKYVLCWEPGGLEEEYTYIPVHEQAKVNDMNVYVNHSTDLGGGYLVEVDGLVLFHMGDHANGEDNLMAEFTREIDMIAAKKKDIDILFGPIRGCGLGTPEQVKKGTYYTLEKLQPALFVPMHSGNYSIEYQAFVEQAQEDGVDQKMHYVMGKGDMFEYSQEQVVD